MPELPEVEVTRLGLAPLATGRTILHIIIRDKRLRVPIADDLPDHIIGKTVSAAHRRGKYLILELAENTEDNNTQKAVPCSSTLACPALSES